MDRDALALVGNDDAAFRHRRSALHTYPLTTRSCTVQSVSIVSHKYQGVIVFAKAR
jgi:hypothetical protein